MAQICKKRQGGSTNGSNREKEKGETTGSVDPQENKEKVPKRLNPRGRKGEAPGGNKPQEKNAEVPKSRGTFSKRKKGVFKRKKS